MAARRLRSGGSRAPVASDAPGRRGRRAPAGDVTAGSGADRVVRSPARGRSGIGLPALNDLTAASDANSDRCSRPLQYLEILLAVG